MEYKLYRKATGDNAGQVLAIVGEHASNEIDKFEVYTITNVSSIELKVYKDQEIKLNSDGRPLWSEVTWTSNKWKLLKTDLELKDIVEGLTMDSMRCSCLLRRIGYRSWTDTPTDSLPEQLRTLSNPRLGKYSFAGTPRGSNLSRLWM